jgi:signal peptidase II
VSKPPADSNSTDAPAGVVPAVVPVSRFVVYAVIVAAGCALDLLTKQAIFAWLGVPPVDGGRADEHTWWLVPNYVGIQTAVNQGAVFGIGQGKSLWFALLSVVAFGGIGYWLFVRKAGRDLLLTVSLSMVSAGILGNLYDRLGLWHSADIHEKLRYGVRDWILFQYQDFVWPNFNLADSLLVCGAGLLLWHAIFRRSETELARIAASDRKPAAKSVS